MGNRSIIEQAEALAGAGRVEAAARMLEGGASGNDADALFLLAMWRMSGRLIPRDLGEAKLLFGQAARAGRRDAAHIHAAFVAHGAGGSPDWPRAMALLGDLAESDEDARSQLDLISAMSLTPRGDPVGTPRPEMLSDKPFAACVRRLLTPDECAGLVEWARPYLEPASVVDPATGRQILNPVRTSDAMSFTLTLENPAIHAINRRLAAATSTRVEQGEPLQVLRYRPGQEYRAHFDALPAAENQREATILVYLNEDYEGGETFFLATELKFRGRVGDALFFRNAGPDGRPDPLSRHAGLPVAAGEKLLASRWIRARPIDLRRPLV